MALRCWNDWHCVDSCWLKGMCRPLSFRSWQLKMAVLSVTPRKSSKPQKAIIRRIILMVWLRLCILDCCLKEGRLISMQTNFLWEEKRLRFRCQRRLFCFKYRVGGARGQHTFWLVIGITQMARDSFKWHGISLQKRHVVAIIGCLYHWLEDLNPKHTCF